MTIRRRTTRVYIDGVETPVREIRTDHDVDQPVGTGSLVMRGPRPRHARLGARVAVQAGHDNVVRPIFHGRIPENDASFSGDGGSFRVEMEGNGRLLWYSNRVDTSVAGPVTLDALFRTYCRSRGVPLYSTDAATNPDGTPLYFGGLSLVDGGRVIVPRSSSPGDVIDRIGRYYGYRTFDTPLGFHRLQKVSGLPTGFYEAAARNYQQGVDLHEVSRRQTIQGMANYIEVFGAEYTALDGSEVAIRSFGSPIPGNSLLGPFGIQNDQIRAGNDIISTVRADAARNVAEIDRSTPPFRYAWTVRGDPEMQPGQVVTIQSPTVNGTSGTDVASVVAGIFPVSLWLMRVGHTITERGWTTNMEGWHGGGEALPAGNDCVTISLTTDAGHHLGNEYLSHYKRPNPNGISVDVPFTVSDEYSTLTARGYAHGCNSFVRNTESEASKFEVWQPHDTERPVASGELPSLKENLEQRYPYGSSVNGDPWHSWSRLVVPLSGSLKSGPATFRILSGVDSEVGDRDDFEVAALTMTMCGVGVPVLISQEM